MEQDMAAFGLRTSLVDQQMLSGMTLSEDVAGAIAPLGLPAPALDEGADPIDGPVVTHELFSRIAALPFERMGAEDVDALLEGLKEKDLPEGDERLAARAQEIVEMLLRVKGNLDEAMGSRFAAGTTRKKRYHKATGAVALAMKMASRKRRRTSAGRKSAKLQLKKSHLGRIKQLMLKRAAKLGLKPKSHPKSAAGLFKAAHKSTGGSQGSAKRSWGTVASSSDSEIALDLRSVLSESRVQSGIRAEVVERLNNIFALMSEMYASDEVDAVLEEALTPVVERATAGTLTEDTLNEDEFVAALAPCLNVVTRVMESIESGDADFDFLGEAFEDEDDDEDESGN
jgi:hypothetical protein